MTKKQQKKYDKLYNDLKKKPLKVYNSPILWVLRYKYKDKFYVEEMEQYFNEEIIKKQTTFAWGTIISAIIIGMYCYYSMTNSYVYRSVFAGFLMYCTLTIFCALYYLIKYNKNCKLYQFLYSTMEDNEETEKTYKETLFIRYPHTYKIHKFFH